MPERDLNNTFTSYAITYLGVEYVGLRLQVGDLLGSLQAPTAFDDGLPDSVPPWVRSAGSARMDDHFNVILIRKEHLERFAALRDDPDTGQIETLRVAPSGIYKRMATDTTITPGFKFRDAYQGPSQPLYELLDKQGLPMPPFYMLQSDDLAAVS